MTMIIVNTISAEVEPINGRPGWFQLTGKNILREMCDCTDELDAHETDGDLVEGAQLLGVSGYYDVSTDDPRFNYQNCEGDRSFGVVKVDGGYKMLLAVNRAEYALFAFLAPHETPAFDDRFEFNADASAAEEIRVAEFAAVRSKREAARKQAIADLDMPKKKAKAKA
jgi:hypothetical protein